MVRRIYLEQWRLDKSLFVVLHVENFTMVVVFWLWNGNILLQLFG